MSIFRELPGFARRLKGGTAFGFRIKLTFLLMVVVVTTTLLALFFTQRSEQAAYQRGLQEKFQSRLGFLLGAQDAREAEVSRQCRQLAKSVRIQAALEEEDMEDLYTVARIELRDVMADENVATSPPADEPRRATFFRFLSADGKLLLPAARGAGLEPWERQLVAAGIGTGNQQIGYGLIQTPGGKMEVHEIVSTPILNPQGELLAALVLGFPMIDLAVKSDAELKTGIWLNGQLHLPALSAAESEILGANIGQVIQASASSDNNFTAWIHGEPYLLFYKILNPNSHFAPAYEICLYSLTGSLAGQQRLRWKILGLATAVLVIGMAASHAFSARLSRPVEQLAEVSAQNLARREEAEAAREMTEQKYRSIFENAVEGIFLLAPDGRFLSANPAMARIFGFDSPDQFIAAQADPLTTLFLKRERGEEFLRRAKTENTVSSFEYEAKRRDGSTLWISQNARAVRNGSGELLHLEGTIEDITDRKEAADLLQTLNAELKKALGDLKATQNQVIQQERLRALGQMASGIAHDFNNSLMPVMGFAELLLAHPDILDDKKKATGYLEMIRTAAKDAASIVARLREFYRSQEHSDVFTPIDLSHLVRQAVSLTQPKWKGQAQANGAEIQIIEKLADVPPISGDESALREVLTNLIFNAVDAMPGGGSLTLRTHCEQQEVVIEVADTGAGMNDEVQRRCLEPFFTTKGERGTGLGLAMVFGIVQRHHGAIDIRTQPGKGTAFVLRFPIHTPKLATASVEPVSASSSKSLRVLLVDDDAQVREVLCAFLEMEGHQVCDVGHGREALTQFGQNEFDLIISDKAMPGMSGDQLAAEIKRLSPRTPVVLLSGFNSTGENEKIPNVNVIASKPITMPALRDAICRAMEPT